MRLDASLVHSSLLPIAPHLVEGSRIDALELPRPQRLAAQALISLLGSARRPTEMAEYARRLNAMLDAEAKFRKDGRNPEWTRLMEHLRVAQVYAENVRTAQSGMACENALMGLESALDDARDLIGSSAPPTQVDPSEAGRLVGEILAALRRSARTPSEMMGYERELYAVLATTPGRADSPPLRDALRRARDAALALEAAASGAAEILARDYLDLALDAAYNAANGRAWERSPYRIARTGP